MSIVEIGLGLGIFRIVPELRSTRVDLYLEPPPSLGPPLIRCRDNVEKPSVRVIVFSFNDF